MIGTTDDALLDEQAERIAALEAENERLRAALQDILLLVCGHLQDADVHKK